MVADTASASASPIPIATNGITSAPGIPRYAAETTDPAARNTKKSVPTNSADKFAFKARSLFHIW